MEHWQRRRIHEIEDLSGAMVYYSLWLLFSLWMFLASLPVVLKSAAMDVQYARPASFHAWCGMPW